MKRGLDLGDSVSINDEQTIQILIGSDLFWDFVLDERIPINKTLGAVNSVFGWVIYGSSVLREESCAQNVAVMKNIVLMNDLTDFWRLDSLGIVETQEICCKDKQIIEQFEKDLRFNNCRYETKLLWNSDPSELESNFFVAEKRFENLKVKLNADKEINREYRNIINEQLADGIVEECTDNKWDDGYFMPHRAVVKSERDTSRVRIVFDASSKAKDCKSLNDLLLSGPNLNPNILDIILKFRKYEVAFSADIEKAFLMISIAEESRKYLKFLWFDDLERETSRVMNMTRLPFGVTSSPFVLAATIKCHLKKYSKEYPETCDMLNSSLYVDDLYYGANCVGDAFRLSSSATFILKNAGMNLRKFNSNSVELKTIWSQNKMLKKESIAHSKVLGLLWNTDEDTIKIDLHELLNNSVNMENITKRVILKIAAKLYDPAGYITPFIIRMKTLMQKIWILGVDWDDDLPLEIKTEFLTWYSELSILQCISIPRKYFPNYDILNNDKISLHIFCDSSQKAYGSVAYFRFINKSDEIKTAFICSKSRVAPLKTLTLPRLELMGAVIASRISKYLHQLFGDIIKNTFLWTDSQIVLCWIKGSSKNWKPFVSNRVAEIQESTAPSNWRFCRGKENPADLLTRGVDGKSLQNSSLWWFGPSWLQESPSNWPLQQSQSCEIKDESLLERRKVTILSSCIIRNREQILDFKHYNSFLKLLRVIAWIYRFLSRARKLSICSGPLTAAEIQHAEMICIRDVQLEYFCSEIQILKSSKLIPADSKIFSLAPFLDENQILRIKGRLEESELTLTEKHPILLPHNSQLTELIVRHEHNKVLHAGVAATLTKVREKYWVPKGRQIIKKVINNCLVCRRFSARPATQMTGQLPRDRIVEAPPFSVTGVDFTGPVYVKLGDEVQKSYITLFTCAITRAIHLELVSDLSSKKFTLALRRFISRRGNCKIFYSDNAKTFKCTNRDIQNFVNIIRENELQNFLSSEGITWKFIVELAPWWGGFYERIMKSIKEPLKKILGRAQLSFEEIMTILTEIENVLNQRPLTYVYSELEEPEPLSPAHFLLAGRKNEYPFHFAEILIPGSTRATKDSLLRRKRYQTKLLRQVWAKWKKEYMLSLRNFHHFKTPHAKKELTVDDVVLVEGSQKSKFLWDLGRITEVFKGRDGLVRSCVVKTKKGLFKRPVQLLYPLELSD